MQARKSEQLGFSPVTWIPEPMAVSEYLKLGQPIVVLHFWACSRLALLARSMASRLRCRLLPVGTE